MAETNGNGRKVVIHAIAIGVATFVEQLLSETLPRLLEWAKARRIYRRKRKE